MITASSMRVGLYFLSYDFWMLPTTGLIFICGNKPARPKKLSALAIAELFLDDLIPTNRVVPDRRLRFPMHAYVFVSSLNV